MPFFHRRCPSHYICPTLHTYRDGRAPTLGPARRLQCKDKRGHVGAHWNEQRDIGYVNWLTGEEVGAEGSRETRAR